MLVTLGTLRVKSIYVHSLLFLFYSQTALTWTLTEPQKVSILTGCLYQAG